MQYRAEHLFFQLSCAVDFHNDGRNVSAAFRSAGIETEKNGPLRFCACNPAVEFFFRLAVDHRPDLYCGIAWIPKRELARSARNHLERSVGYIVLYAQQSQRRASLAGGTKCRH